jgi:hypothetical protein
VITDHRTIYERGHRSASKECEVYLSFWGGI